jgi:hypothetical protein
MDYQLTPEEVRVLGCLVEKRLSTPDSYPLTMNATVLACNQTSNRDPLVEYDSATVNAALKSTRSDGWSMILSGAGARVPRFKEALSEKLELPPASTALLAELMLRGPQTPGELRVRCTRMHRFDDLETVESALQEMASRPRPLVVKLQVQPGRREARYAHLLGGPVEDLEWPDESPPPRRSTVSDLEERVARLEEQLQEVLGRLSRLEE